jgi:pimeloyl-ACP methyl ester carboxylesterase
MGIPLVIALSIVLLLTAILAMGMWYQAAGSRRDERLYTHGGRWISAGPKLRLYALESGSGSPTVLFESGIGATNLNWRRIQDGVAQFTATVSYDRSGLGWSSPSRSARTPRNIAAELHAMLRNGGIQPPFILVGHSFGGLVVRRYALLYPEDVAGILLVDPMRCEEWPPLHAAKQREIDRGRRLIRFASPLARCGVTRLAMTALMKRNRELSEKVAGVAGTGGRHVFRRLTTEVRKMPRETWPIVVAHWSRPGFYAGMRRHIEAIPDTVREMHAADSIREIPVTVLTPAAAAPLSEECLRRIGDRVQQIIAPASEHWIHLDQPQLVIDAIRGMVEAAAGQSVTPISCSSN